MKKRTRAHAVYHRAIILGALSVLLTGWGDRAPGWPHAGPMPDEPIAGPPAGYQSIVDGTKSYRPVEPMPWGDVNRRVAPALGPGAAPSGDASPSAPPTTTSPPNPHSGH